MEHIWTGRPPAAKVLLPLYLAHPAPRPSLTYLPDTNPPSLVYSLLQDRLLFLCPSSRDSDSLATLEFLHRVADALEDYLGSPLLPSKIETSYDVVAQLLLEMCDGGTVATTEPNALREVVEAPSWMKSLVGGLGLPSASPSIGTSASSNFPVRPVLTQSGTNQNNIAMPWRKSNVRHTSNELYVDIVETLHVILAPSGRPLSAFAHGTIAFTCKVSGIPDLLLVLSTPGGQHTVGSTLQLPVFHPCVRLARWKERPGELSFVPPDGRFLLLGYEVDLLSADYLERAISNPKVSSGLQVPASVDVRSGLGPSGAEFEVRLLIDPRFDSRTGSGATSATRDAFAKPTGLGAKAGGTSAHPIVEDIVVRVPIAPGVRNLTDIKPSRGEANYSPGDRVLEWKLGARDAASLAQGMHSSAKGVVATLKCTVLGAVDNDEREGGVGMEMKTETWDYDEDAGGAYQDATKDSTRNGKSEPEQNAKNATSAAIMPNSASVSFQVKGWLASGIRVEKLVIDPQRSRGLGAGVQPYKGVKYLTVSESGIETRC